MKKTFTGLALAAFLTIPLQAGVVSSFNDLAFWTGTGASQSSLVIQWNDSKSPQALAWGFKWTSASTVNDMLLTVLSADVLLFARGDSSTGFGAAYFGFGYSNSGNFSVAGAVDSLGAAVTPVFTNGFSEMNTDSAATQAPFSSASAAPANAVDRYAEGWNDNGFWDLYTGTGQTYPATWSESLVGSGEELVNNGWYVFTITTPEFTPNLPGVATAAVPEPSTFLLLLAGAILYLYARKRIHSC